jgi:hypothetical protein
MKLIVGNNYNWKHNGEPPLIYIGKQGSWHQFVTVEKPDVVWCEVLDSDLHMLEETVSESVTNDNKEVI